METDYLSSAQKQFEYYKSLGEKTIAQIPEDKLFWQYNEDSNSIATIVKHLSGNMLSRWTDFLTSDGEKTTRNREAEFDNDSNNMEELLCGPSWLSLSIPRGKSDVYNAEKFSKPKHKEHFTDEVIEKKRR
ncbi:hypothetical protein D3C87_215320 [compost metagenome]